MSSVTFPPNVGGSGVSFPLLATPAGSAAAPSYSSLLDPTTGAFIDVAGEYAAAVAGVERMRLTADILKFSKGLATDPLPIALPAPTADDFPLPAGLFFPVQTPAVTILSGIVAPAPSVTRILVLVNNGPMTITLAHDSAASAAPNRFYLSLAGPPQFVAAFSKVLMFYDPTVSRWRVTTSI